MSGYSNRNRPIKRKRDTQPTPGTPGYRLRLGRTGLDPMENAREASYLEGKFIRYLFTGQLRIKSRLWLSITGIIGVACIMPLAIYAIILLDNTPPSIAITAEGNGVFRMSSIYGWLTPYDLCILVPLAAAGLALLINVTMNIARNRRRQ